MNYELQGIYELGIMHQDVLAAAFSLSAMQVLGTPASQLSTKLLEDPHLVVKYVAFLLARQVGANTMTKHLTHIKKVLVWRASLGGAEEQATTMQALLEWVEVLHR